MYYCFKLCVIVFLIHITNGAQILGIFNEAFYSHYSLGHKLLQELANKGHEVTMISVFQRNDTGNYKNIYLDGLEEQGQALLEETASDAIQVEEFPDAVELLVTQEYDLFYTEATLKHPKLQKHLTESHHYDVVIIDQNYNEALKGLCYHYKASCISFCTTGPTQQNNHIMGNFAPPSFISHVFVGYGSELSFFQRTYNTFFAIYGFVLNSIYLRRQNSILQTYFPKSPDIYEIICNTSLMLLNSHPTITQPVPLLPNMIEIGGFHMDEPKKLPIDILKWMDEAENGVIYVSFGTIVTSQYLKVEKRRAIMNAFRGLKQNVIWKFDDPDSIDFADNVKILKWVPQQDVLVHPNLKLFITHGGLLSLIESITRGVPVVGVPLFSDQETNMANILKNGCGVQVLYTELTQDTLKDAINEVINNKRYKENAIERSELMMDRPMKPLDTALFWIENAIKHKGVPHLRSAGVRLTWYQFFSIDVFIFFVFMLSLFVIFITKLCSCIKLERGILKCKND